MHAAINFLSSELARATYSKPGVSVMQWENIDVDGESENHSLEER